jgi:hypothetical protein
MDPKNKPSNEKSKTQKSKLPIREIPAGIESTYFSKEDLKMLERDGLDQFLDTLSQRRDIPKQYTVEDLIDVWCRGVTNGATMWQYCQDTHRILPNSFEAGLLEVVNEIRSSKDKAVTLQAVINNNMILLGVFDEKL